MHRFYRFLTDITAPFISVYLRMRRVGGREDEARFQERLGHTSVPRPKGKLVWCHAASVGEALSVLTLLKNLQEGYPEWNFLITTGTVTSAAIVKERKLENVIHQYVPVDRWSYVMRFLRHWEPDLVLWVESELWPNMLTALSARNVPAILLNGRMSDRSYRRWRMIPGGAKEILSSFVLGLTQTGIERNRFASLGLQDVRAIGNLKYAADPLPYDAYALEALADQVGERPVWLMASTHEGEEDIALHVHKQLHKTLPDLLTIIVPRHPGRGVDIAALIEKEGRTGAQRSLNEPITEKTEIYLADTMGELGLFYRLSPLCCLAGSFTWGGHNLVEPAQLGCSILFGPKMENFLLMADDILSESAAVQVTDAGELAEKILHYIREPEERQKLSDAAYHWAETKQGVLDETLKVLAPYFSSPQKRG